MLMAICGICALFEVLMRGAANLLQLLLPLAIFETTTAIHGKRTNVISLNFSIFWPTVKRVQHFFPFPDILRSILVPCLTGPVARMGMGIRPERLGISSTGLSLICGWEDRGRIGPGRWGSTRCGLLAGLSRRHW